ncbi:hypothetical protein CK623_11410 [Vandammella animalimorsus]|uniref:Tape measure protein N-terminal domain-containing protein n=1 Tax=Vandammella animalimorsus TaxID=2029117 RepID=A0A2A2AN43_9BURK|nr:tape measure protein [Vandammella animalimorsus]PAT39163.1 hypothetical protein CK623_11410 [Vandammella animalimorsus]
MADGNTKRVGVEIGVEVKGQQAVPKLAEELQELAKQGGEAAPELEGLAAELENLAQQKGAIEQFVNLKAKTGEYAQAAEQAQQATKAAALTMKEKQAALAEAQKAEQALAEQVQQSRADQERLQTSIKEAVQALEKLGAQSREAGQRAREHGQGLREAGEQLERLQAEQLKSEGRMSKLKERHEGLAKTIAATAQRLDDLQQKELKTGQSAKKHAQAIVALQLRLEKLGASYSATGQKIDRLSQRQSELAEAIPEAKNRLAELGAQSEQAGQNASQYGQQLTKLREQLARLRESADQAAADTRALSAAQREAAVSARSLQAQAKEAEHGFNRQRRSAQQAGAAYDESRIELQRLRDAMAQAGVSSADLAASQLRVRTEMAQTQARARELVARHKELAEKMTLAQRAAAGLRQGLAQIAAGNVIANAVGRIVSAVSGLGNSFLRANVQHEQFVRALNAIYKDSSVAAGQLQFLRRAAGEAGVAVEGISEAFIKYSASMHSANVPTQQANELFAALTRAAGTLGLSGDKVAHMLEALGQMAGKGVVSMEELRQQLGDSLPGAFSLVAKGLGVTEAELIKLVESGNLAARDLFPALTLALQDLHGQTDGMGATWARFHGALTVAMQGIGQSGVVALLTAALKGLGLVVGAVTVALHGFAEAAFLAWDFLARGVKSVFTLSNQFEGFGEQVAAAGERIGQTTDAFAALVTQTERAEKTQAKLTASIREQLQAQEGLSAGQRAAQLVQEQLAVSAEKTRNNYVAVTAALAELTQRQQEHSKLAAKQIGIAKDEAKILIKKAKLLEDEYQLLEASQKGAELVAEATQAALKSKQQELAILEQELVAHKLRAQASDMTEAQIRQEQQAIEGKIAASRTEVEQMLAQREQAQQELAVRRAAVQVYGEQAKSVQQYREEADQAAKAVQELLSMQKDGIDVADRLSKAQAELTYATEALRLAKQKEREGIELENRGKIQALQISRDGLRLQADVLRAKADTAKANGEEALSEIYLAQEKKKRIAIMRLEVQIQELTIKGKLAEIELKLKELHNDKQKNKQQIQKLELEKQLHLAGLKQLNQQKELVNLAEKQADGQDKLGKKLKETGEAGQEAGEKISAAAKTIQSSWLSAATAASKHAQEAAKHAHALAGEMEVPGRVLMSWSQLDQLQAEHLAKLKRLADEYVQSMTRLDDMEAKLTRSSSGRARALADLELRLLELSGNQEAIARAKQQRDLAELETERAKLDIELQRAQIRGDDGKLQEIQQELALLDAYTKKLKEVHAAEDKQRRDAARAEREQRQQQERERAERERSQAAAAPSPAAQSDAVVRTHRIELQGRRYDVPTTPQGGQAIDDLLRAIARAKGASA